MEEPLTPPSRMPRLVLRSALVWGAAGGLALAAHGAVALLALRPAQPLPPGPPGPPAVLLDLAPLPRSAATDQDRFGPDAIDAPDIPEPPEPETRAALVETAAALPPAALALPPVPRAPGPPDLAAAPPVVPPPPEPAREPRPAPRPVELSRRPPPKVARPETARSRTAQPESTKSEKPPSQAATAARIRAARPSETAAGSSGGGGAAEGEISRWKAQVMARLRSRMVYPSAEQAAGRGGTAIVQIFLTPEGVVRSARLTQSSGNRAVDAAALSAARMASPLPKPPPGAPLDLGAPFTFTP